MLWVSIKKDMPKVEGKYIVNIRDSFRNTNFVCVMQYYGGVIGWCNNHEGIITHWMPMPDRPNVED